MSLIHYSTIVGNLIIELLNFENVLLSLLKRRYVIGAVRIPKLGHYAWTVSVLQ